MTDRKRKSSSVRSGRKRSRNRAPISAPPFIKRLIPTYDIAPEETLEMIETASDRILAETGMDIKGDPESIELFKSAGAKVENERVRFEPGMLREILKSAPAQFTQHARNPKKSVELGGDNVVFVPAYGSPFVMDLDNGRRYGKLEDFKNFIKLAYASPWLHHSGGTICEPVDIPVNKRHLDMVYSHIRYSDRAFMGSVTAPSRAEDSIEMCRILFGSEYVDKNCVILGNVNVNSPLVWDVSMTKALRAYARANQAAVVAPFILGGAMGPVTTAGGIAQSLAEAMVGCALTQLERKGAPVIFANFLSSMSLKSGSPTFGTPEPAVGTLIVGQLARRLKLPLRCGGSFTTSKLPDAQAMQESTVSMFSAVLSGGNFILHTAGFLDGLLSMSYEKFVLDTDFAGALHTYLAGVKIDDDTLAVDSFKEVGPGNHFFGCAHTLAHYETAFWNSELADNDPWETWHENGDVDSMTRANKLWKKILEEYEPPELDPGIDEALLEFIQKRKDSMEDMWH